MRTSVVTIMLLLAVAVTASAEKSGVKPQVLSLPSGPGSIEGMGESFEPQLNSGVTSYSIKLKTMPGRANLVPDLTLQYNGGSGNGPFGLGWSLPVNCIRRQTDDGLPEYNSNDTFIANGKDLVYVGNGFYRQEIEDTFTRYSRTKDGWLGETKSGAKFRYGSAPRSQVRSGEKIFSWMLDEIEDSNSNQIHYLYSSFDSENPQLYCASIIYSELGGHRRRIEFEYEERSDVFADYRPTFRLETGYRCKSIAMFTDDSLVRRYSFSYVENCNVSLLAAIENFGADGVSSLPPAHFSYTGFDVSSGSIIQVAPSNSDAEYPFLALSNEPDAALNDMNCDGLPDLLWARPGEHVVFLNAGIGSDGIHRWGARLEMMSMSPAEALGSPGVSLADINGDGRTDFVARQTADTFFWWPNDATGFWGAPVVLSDNTNLPPQDFESPLVRLVDVNFDKHTDLMYAFDPDAEEYAFFLNRGDGEFGTAIVRPGTGVAGLTFDTRLGMKLADMNGDRLQDILLIEDNFCVYWPSSGIGTWDSAPRGDWGAFETGSGTRMTNPPDSVSDQEPSLASLAETIIPIDMNGDGLSDLAYIPEGATYLLYWINCDSLRFEGPYRFSNVPVKTSSTTIELADMNGNGTTDIVWNFPDGSAGNSGRYWQYLEILPGEKAYLLKSAANGTGRTTTFEYGSSTAEKIRDEESGENWSSSLPTPVNVLKAFSVEDGIGGYYRTELKYHDGFYDGQEKEFRGFARATCVELGGVSGLNALGGQYDLEQGAPSLTTEYLFDTGALVEALKGKPIQVTAFSGIDGTDGIPFYSETNEWEARELAKGIDGDSRVSTFALRRSNARDILEEGRGVPVRLESEYDYDDFGNLIFEAIYGRVENGDRSAWDDERITVYAYTGTDTEKFDYGLSSHSVDTDPNEWIWDRLVEKETRDDTGLVIARQQNFYDGMPLGETGGRGNQTESRDWHTPDSPDGFIRTVRRDFDEFGNPIRIYDPLYGEFSGHFREIAYDPVFQTFPISENIDTGKESPAKLLLSATYELGFGVVTSSTDFNGNTTLYVYDPFGRPASVVKPYDSMDTPTTTYTYALGAPVAGGVMNWVETRQREGTGGGTLDSRSYIDGLGRTRLTRSEGSSSNEIIVTDAVQFNTRRDVSRKYLPYYDTGSLDWNPPSSKASHVALVYDALGRDLSQTQPDGSSASTEYLPMERIQRDEEQTNPDSSHYQCGVRLVDDGLLDEEGKGRLREVYEIVKLAPTGEPAPLTSWKSRYDYDVLNDVTSITDSQGNTKTMLFDGLRRRLFVDDVDRGWTYYAYDDASNIVRSRDARGLEVAYSHDGVNRTTAEYYISTMESSAGNLAWGEKLGIGEIPGRTPDVEYHYDVSSGPLDTSFRTMEEVILEAVLSQRYETGLDLNDDKLLNVADLVEARKGDTDLVAAIGNAFLGSNTLGQLAWVRDTSGEEHNSYDQRERLRERLKSIKDTAQSINRNFHLSFEYDSMDRLVRHSVPNEVAIEYRFDSRGLLSQVPGAIETISYDAAGNILTQVFSCGVTLSNDYDSRYRMVRQRAQCTSDAVALQDRRYTFDRVSNILQIEDLRSDAALRRVLSDLNSSDSPASGLRQDLQASYDSLYRLTGAKYADASKVIDYRYDGIGNMLSSNSPSEDGFLGAQYGGSSGSAGRFGRAFSDEPGPHALTAYTPSGEEQSPARWLYDANGNVISTPQYSATWDHKDRIVSTEFVSDARKLDFLYDHDDKRVAKKVTMVGSSDVECTFYLDESVEYRDGALNAYVVIAGQRVALLQGGESDDGTTTASKYFLQDQLGSTTMELDHLASVESASIYAPFGGTASALRRPGTEGHPYQYIDRERDDERGFDSLERRYYNPNFGRFLSTDPVILAIGGPEEDAVALLLHPQGLNPYAYSENRPLIKKDPNGQHPVLIGAFLGAAVEVGRQMYFEDKGLGDLNLVKIGVQTFIGGATGGLAPARGLASALASSAALNLAPDTSGGIAKGLGASDQLANSVKLGVGASTAFFGRIPGAIEANKAYKMGENALSLGHSLLGISEGTYGMSSAFSDYESSKASDASSNPSSAIAPGAYSEHGPVGDGSGRGTFLIMEPLVIEAGPKN